MIQNSPLFGFAGTAHRSGLVPDPGATVNSPGQILTDQGWQLILNIIGYTPENIAHKGQPNGYAPLDANSKVPLANLYQASSTDSGYISNTDWISFNSKQNALGFTPENSANKAQQNGYAPLDTNTKVPLTNLYQASSTVGGYLSNTDWNTFNNKQNALSFTGSTAVYLNGNGVFSGINAVNGAAVPINAAYLGTNNLGQLIAQPNIGTLGLQNANNVDVTDGTINVNTFTLNNTAALGSMLVGNGTTFVGKTLTMSSNLASSKSFGSSYTNLSGGNMMVSVTGIIGGSYSQGFSIAGYVNGVKTGVGAVHNDQGEATYGFLVPSGASYSVNIDNTNVSNPQTPSLEIWIEYTYN